MLLFILSLPLSIQPTFPQTFILNFNLTRPGKQEKKYFRGSRKVSFSNIMIFFIDTPNFDLNNSDELIGAS